MVADFQPGHSALKSPYLLLLEENGMTFAFQKFNIFQQLCI